MGLNIGLNALTTGILSITTIFLVIMGILLVNASDKIDEIPEFNQSSTLQEAKDRLTTAYILIFIAAGVSLLLGIAYGGHDVVWSPTEWIHGFLFLVMLVLLVIGTIYAYTVLVDLYVPEISDRNGASSFIWAALLFAILTFMMAVITGSGRAGYNAVRSHATCRVNEAERKIHETHSHHTGEGIDYDFIGSSDPAEGPLCKDAPSDCSNPPPVLMTTQPTGCNRCGY